MSDTQPDLPRFVAESTLGRLAKWLRLAGLDTRLDDTTPDPSHLLQIARSENRIILTRTKSVHEIAGGQESLFIHFNTPMNQIHQVMRHFKVQQRVLRPLTRCTLCNHLLARVDKTAVQGAVPEHVWINQDRFMTCRLCRRIYWPGTHASHINELIELWFR